MEITLGGILFLTFVHKLMLMVIQISGRRAVLDLLWFLVSSIICSIKILRLFAAWAYIRVHPSVSLLFFFFSFFLLSSFSFHGHMVGCFMLCYMN